MPIIGAQTYTVREYTQDEDGFAKSMDRLSRIGFKHVQLSKIADMPAAKVRQICDGSGLGIVLTHTDPKKILEQTEMVIEEHICLGAKYIGIGVMPAHYKENFDGVKRFISDYQPIAEEIHAAGLKLMYHNHMEEFAKFEGKLVMDHFAEAFDKEILGFTLDTAWVQAGGGDTAWWLRRLSGRLDTIHFKDMVYTLQGEMRTAEVMEGNLNWESIFEVCKDPATGIKYAFIEQDHCYGKDPFDSLEISLENLINAGFSA